MIFGFGSFFLLVRVLTKEEMGTWSLFFTIITILETSKAGLVKNALIKYINSEPQSEHSKIETASLSINSLFSLLAGFIIFLSADFLGELWNIPSLATMLCYYIIALIILIPFSHFEYIQQANSSFSGILASYLVRQGFFFASVVILTFWFDGYTLLHYLVLLQAVGIGFGSVVGYAHARKFLAKKITYSVLWVKKLWGYGKFVLATNISSLIFRSTDQIMIASYISTAAVALYNVSIRITNLLDIPSTVAAEVIFPKSVKMINEDKSSGKYLYERSVGIIMALLLPASIIILLFPESILHIIAGSGYVEAAGILQVTILYGLFLPFLKQFGTLMDASGYPNINFKVIFTLAVTNVIANYVFIKLFGLLGAAYGTLFTYLVSYLISQTVLYKKLGVNALKIFMDIFVSYKDIYRIIRSKRIL